MRKKKATKGSRSVLVASLHIYYQHINEEILNGGKGSGVHWSRKGLVYRTQWERIIIIISVVVLNCQTLVILSFLTKDKNYSSKYRGNDCTIAQKQE